MNHGGVGRLAASAAADVALGCCWYEPLCERGGMASPEADGVGEAANGGSADPAPAEARDGGGGGGGELCVSTAAAGAAAGRAGTAAASCVCCINSCSTSGRTITYSPSGLVVTNFSNSALAAAADDDDGAVKPPAPPEGDGVAEGNGPAPPGAPPGVAAAVLAEGEPAKAEEFAGYGGQDVPGLAPPRRLDPPSLPSATL